tara:strand:- start:95 stop:733 length:639 start_codon:yes stop_codon:yes gene_type:complete
MALRRTVEDSETTSVAPPTRPLSIRQRLALIIQTGVAAETIVDMPDAEIDYDFLLSNGVRAPLLKAAKITPVQLKARGVQTASAFKNLDFTTLYLVDGAFCASCVAAYGADELLAEFLITPQDAVALAGSSAMQQLGIDLGTLLIVCCGSPELAYEVVAQTPPRGNCLRGVAPETLLDTGLRAKTLRQLGYTAETVSAQTRATVGDLDKLGF